MTVKRLNDKELTMIKINDLQEALAKAESLLESKQVEILTLQQRLLAAKIVELQAKHHKLEEQKNHFVEVKRDFIKTLAKKHKLVEGKWGFDPDSGEIKED